MRKLPWLLLLLPLVLSSCILVVGLPASDFRFDSNWRRTSDGAYVFCTNQDSYIRYSFRAPDPDRIQSITEIYPGNISGRTLVEPRPKADLTYSNGRYTFVGKLTFGQTGVPQSLQPFAVVVVPVLPPPVTTNPPPPSKNGETEVTVEVVSTAGVTYRGTYTYDTYANCP
uniref:Lipoprotein n=1 Tax=Meiothermus ruber TaxID=277 RepID=A0A7C3I3S1_MEIRU